VTRTGFAWAFGLSRLILALSAVTFVAAHQLFYLLYAGADSAAVLAGTGHDIKWTLAVVSVGVLAVALVACAARELIRLTDLVRRSSLRIRALNEPGMIEFVRSFAWLWLATLVLAIAMFVLVENLERTAAGLATPGIGVLSASSWGDPMLILELVAGAVALVATLYRSRRASLEAVLAAARERRWSSAPAIPSRRLDDTFVAQLADALTPPGRAPPFALSD
jgi:hypothetical protein